jgi:tripartite-type tricarboxylate transporter receptor subunit TctC
MTIFTRRTLAGLAATTVLVAAFAADAQDWPIKGKPVNVIVSAGAGSGQDLTARLLTDQLSREFPGSLFQIVNRPGAGTQVGTQAIADAAPDGYTFGVIALPTAVTLHLDPARQARFTGASFEPAANFIYDPGALAVPADSKYQTLADLVADAKARPGAITVGVTGPQGREHLDVTAVEQIAGVKFNPVFHNDSGAALNSMLGKNIAAMQGSVGDFLSQVQAGRVRLIAVFSDEPSRFAPTAPTAKSLGFPVVSGVSRGFAFPKGAPRDAVQKLEAAIKKIGTSPDGIAAVEKMGFEMKVMDAPTFAKYWASETDRITDLFKKAAPK